MRWRSLVVPALALSYSIAAAAPSRGCDDPTRIVGGHDTTIEQHPWQVALDIDGELCGGAIIAADWVLTAAHCFYSDDPKKVRVKSGATNYRGSDGVWTPAERVVLGKLNSTTKE